MRSNVQTLNCEFIKNRREKLGFTLRQLAEMTGIDAASLSRIENYLKPSIETATLVKIARALNCHPGEMILF